MARSSSFHLNHSRDWTTVEDKPMKQCYSWKLGKYTIELRKLYHPDTLKFRWELLVRDNPQYNWEHIGYLLYMLIPLSGFWFGKGYKEI